MAAIDVFFGAMIGPALMLLAFGLGLFGVSLLWPAVSQRRPAAQLDRAATGYGYRAPAQEQGIAPGWRPEQPAQPTYRPTPRPAPTPAYAAPDDPTLSFDAVAPPNPPGYTPPEIYQPTAPAADAATTTWVEGVGYVDDDR